jgi:formate dehydrogenase iron-sulfur subunit
MCYARLARGVQPACSEACPTGATLFGDRDELISKAYARFAADPTKYVHKVYGLEEAGGTSVLYIANTDFESLGFKTKLQHYPLPMLTWNALSKVPSVVSVGGVLLYGIYWITNRRNDVAKEERRNGSSGPPRNGEQKPGEQRKLVK